MSIQKTPGNSRELVCSNCGTLFRKLNMDYNVAVKKGQTEFYCSTKCKPRDKYSEAALKRHEEIGSYVHLECDECKTIFKRKKGDFRKWIIENKIDKYCSRSCSVKKRAKSKKGEANYLRDIIWQKFHKNVLLPLNPDLIDKECWIWKGHFRGDYGAFYWNGSKYMGAHQASFQIYYRPYQEGMVIMHSCDNGKCVNPFHLSEGTQRDNCLDAVKKGHRSTGEMNCRAKNYDEDVIEMRRLSTEERWGVKALAEKFNLSVGHVRKILKYKHWKHI